MILNLTTFFKLTILHKLHIQIEFNTTTDVGKIISQDKSLPMFCILACTVFMKQYGLKICALISKYLKNYIIVKKITAPSGGLKLIYSIFEFLFQNLIFIFPLYKERCTQIV
jgi:hypothetical protein